MKKGNLLVWGLMMVMGLSSCIKDNVTPDNSAEEYEKYRKERLAIETPLIKDFLEENGLNAMEHEGTGIWYIVESPGQGNHQYYTGPATSAQFMQTRMVIEYTGRLLNGDVFDELADPDPAKDFIYLFSDAYSRGVIPAWQFAFVPSAVGGILTDGLQEGATIRIITPSPYAYQDKEYKNSEGKVIIPANSILDFTIEVIDLSNPTN